MRHGILTQRKEASNFLLVHECRDMVFLKRGGYPVDVTMAVAAENIEFDRSSQGDKINILGVLDEVACGAVPCSVPQITILIGFSADAADFGTQKLITVQERGETQSPAALSKDTWVRCPRILRRR
jgi:hypothetical protein